MVLFMSSSNYLVPPASDPSKEELWTETWKRIDRFLPDLKGELAFDEQPEEPAPESGKEKEKEKEKKEQAE